jgi:hypothetical protein
MMQSKKKKYNKKGKKEKKRNEFIFVHVDGKIKIKKNNLSI